MASSVVAQSDRMQGLSINALDMLVDEAHGLVSICENLDRSLVYFGHRLQLNVISPNTVIFLMLAVMFDSIEYV